MINLGFIKLRQNYLYKISMEVFLKLLEKVRSEKPEEQTEPSSEQAQPDQQ